MHTFCQESVQRSHRGKMEDFDVETRRILSKMLEFARFLLSYQQLNESYKIYHCMRKMCDDTQINLDLEFMKQWIEFVKGFISRIVDNNQQSQQTDPLHRPLWTQQMMELCEFDVKVWCWSTGSLCTSTEPPLASLTTKYICFFFIIKVLEKIGNTTKMAIGFDLCSEYLFCANALMRINTNHDRSVVMRCQYYLRNAAQSPHEQTRTNAQHLLQRFGC